MTAVFIVRSADFVFCCLKNSQVNTSLNTDAKATERGKPAGLAYFVLTRTRTGRHSLSIQRFTSLPMPAKIKS